MFNEQETRTLCESRPGMVGLDAAIRTTCPAHIFQHVLENRARKIGLVHTITDEDRRAAAARTAKAIAEDKARDNETHDRLVAYGQELTF